MTCSSIMTHNPKTVTDSETIGHAMAKLLENHCINLPVVDGKGRLVGLFGLYELLALLVPRVAMVGDLLPNLRFMSDHIGELQTKCSAFKDKPLRHAIDREPVTLYPDTPAIEAVRLLCHHHMTIPVVEQDRKKLVGVITYWDVARAITEKSK